MKRIRFRRFQKAVLLLIAVALLGAPAAWAVPGREDPVPAVAQADKPIVTVEGNAVVDSSGKTTGYFELALKVKTGEKPAAGATAPESRFYSASVALRYNATVLQPVSWDYMPSIENPAFDDTQPESDSNPKTITVGTDYTEAVKTATAQSPLAVETKKDDAAVVAEAKIAGYVAASTEAGAAQTEKYDTAQITLTAQAPTGGKVYYEDTIVCVVRFKYDKDAYPMLETNESFRFVNGVVGAASGAGPAVRVPNVAARAGAADQFDATAVWMANDGEAAMTSAGQMAWYEGFVNGEKTALYHYVGAPAMSGTKKRPAGTVGAGMPLPETVGKAAFSYSTTGSTYSYEDNLLTAKSCHVSDLEAESASANAPVAGDLVFVLVNAESYAKEGSDPDKMCAVLFYDWDDTLIGTLVVQKDQDARQAVNKYVKDHLIHPELTVDGADITSMERKDNYRGKYPNTPAAEGVLNPKGDAYIKAAEGYPLSNKLDYVFLKRPMGHDGEAPKAEDYTDNEKYQAALKAWEAKWVQTSKENDTDPSVKEATWDTELPYIYGWAEVADPAHPEEVWTTLGVGELDFYNQESSTFGRYIEIGNNPARLTVQDQEFTFADFDFSTNTQDDTAYAVKAIYEPGLDLPNSTTPYRLAREPYYSKLSAGAAASGGAYEIVSAFERANVADGALRGVPRTREPAVRQDTTTDYRWIKNEDLDVENNIPNVLDYDAYTGKGETTYTLVPVDNVDYISFSLSLSARQNKVDYYLVDAYGSSFVAGQRRAISDAPTRSQGTPTIDNYNYYTTESDALDAYYDATYANRDGSRGFVLSGTLNVLMEKASHLELGLIEETEFNQYVTLEAFQDANVRGPDGYFYEGIQILNARQTLRDAAKAAKAAGKWNGERNCAQLTYHELQNFIINGSLDDGGTISWCHYHQACADTQSGKPGDWNELIAMATNGSDADLANIALLTPPEIEVMTRLRRTDGGTWDPADFARRLSTAVQAGNTTWDTIQFALDTSAPTGVDPETYAKAHYWWYDGSTSVSFSNWTDLGAAVKAAVEGSSEGMPDGSLVGAREAKLRQLESIFNANATAAEDTPTTAWVRATRNLRVNETTRYTDFEAFIGDVKAAYTEYGAWPEWGQVQNHIIEGNGTISADAAVIQTYWWVDDGYQLDSLENLLRAASGTEDRDKAAWETVKDHLYTDAEFFFAADFKGTRFDTTGDLSALKTALSDVVEERGTGTSWNNVQYYLIHGVLLKNNLIMSDESDSYYWWKNGGSNTAVDFSSTDPETLVDKLLDAAYRDLYNSQPTDNVWANLTSDVLETARLIKKDNSVGETITFGEQTKYDDATEVQTAIKAMVNAQTTLTPGRRPAIGDMSWHQVQHYLFNKSVDTTENIQNNTNYWWYSEGQWVKPSAAPDVLFANMSTAYSDAVAGNITWEAFEATLTDADMNAMGFTIFGAPFEEGTVAGYSGAWSGIGYSSITWYHVQIYLLDWYISPDPAVDYADYGGTLDSYLLNVHGITAPDWVPALTSDMPIGPMEAPEELTEEEKQIRALSRQMTKLTTQMARDPQNALAYLTELNQLIAQLNALTGYVAPDAMPPAEIIDPTVEGTDPTVEGTEPPGETTDPTVEGTDPAEGETKPPVEETDPTVTEQDPPAEETDPPVEETDPTDTETKPPAEDTEPPTEQTDPTEEVTDPPGTETDQPGDEATPPTEETGNQGTEETGEPDLVMVIPNYYTQLTFRAPSLMTLPPTASRDSWLIYFTNAWRYRP